MEDHRSINWIFASENNKVLKTPESLASLGDFFKMEQVCCLLITAYYTAFCFHLESSACCPQPTERSLCILIFFWRLAATVFFAITSLTRCNFSFPPSHSGTASLFFNSISTSLVTSSLYPHSWKLSFFSFIHFHSFFSSHLADTADCLNSVHAMFPL